MLLLLSCLNGVLEYAKSRVMMFLAAPAEGFVMCMFALGSYGRFLMVLF